MSAALEPIHVDNATAASIRTQASMMLRAAIVWTLPFVVGGIVLSAIVRGIPGLLGALFGVGLGLASAGASALVLHYTAQVIPTLFLGAMSLVFVGKLAVFLVVFLVFRDTTSFDGPSFALTLMAVTLAWTIGECMGLHRAVSRSQTSTSGGES